jgi:S1-C subfamily serine protease
MDTPATAFGRHGLIPWLFLFLLIPTGAIALVGSSAGKAWLDRLAIHADAARFLPGITAETAVPRGRGFVITSIQSDSDAAKCGVAVGDVIVAIDDVHGLSLAQARYYLLHDTAGGVRLQIVHDRRARNIWLSRDGEST